MHYVNTAVKFYLTLLTSSRFAFTMAWRSSGRTNEELVENLYTAGIIKSEKVKNVMLEVDRGKYCKNAPYFDSPQPIGFGVTISAPHMVSHVYR